MFTKTFSFELETKIVFTMKIECNILRLWRRPVCQSLLKALDISSARAQVAPNLLKALAILTDTTIRRSAFDREDRKPNSKSEKRPHFSRRSASLLFTRFFKDFPNYRKKTNRVIVFCQTPFPNILKYRNYWWDLQTIWRTRFLQKNIEEFT